MERVFCIVPRTEANGFFIYSARIVDDFKNVCTPAALEKSRFVVRAFSDDANNYMTYEPTVQRFSKLLLLCFALCDQTHIPF